MTEAIRIRRSGHRGSASPEPAGAADGSPGRAGGAGAGPDPAAERSGRPGAGLPQRPRRLAAAASGGRGRRARRWARARCCRSETARSPCAAEAGRCVVLREGALCVPGPSERHAVRVGAWLREEARRTCVAAVDRARRRAGPAARARQPARPALALGLVHGDGRSHVLVAADPGALGGARLRGGARGGAPGRAQPFAALLGGGAAALPGLRASARLAAAERRDAAHARLRARPSATGPPEAGRDDRAGCARASRRRRRTSASIAACGRGSCTARSRRERP